MSGFLHAAQEWYYNPRPSRPKKNEKWQGLSVYRSSPVSKLHQAMTDARALHKEHRIPQISVDAASPSIFLLPRPASFSEHIRVVCWGCITDASRRALPHVAHGICDVFKIVNSKSRDVMLNDNVMRGLRRALDALVRHQEEVVELATASSNVSVDDSSWKTVHVSVACIVLVGRIESSMVSFGDNLSML